MPENGEDQGPVRFHYCVSRQREGKGKAGVCLTENPDIFQREGVSIRKYTTRTMLKVRAGVETLARF